MTRRWLPYDASAVLIALCLALSVARGAEPIRIAVQKIGTIGTLFIAADKGYFADEGLAVQFIYFDAATPMAVAAVAGDVDFGVTGLTAGFYSLAGQGQLKLIAGYVREVPNFQSNAIVVSNRAYAAGLTGFKDLVGHSVAVTQIGSAPHYVVGLLAEKFGFDIDTVRILPLQSNANAVSAVVGGQADAGVIPVTLVMPAIERGDVKLLGFAGDVTPWQLGGAYTTTKLANGRPDLVNAFLRAYRRGSHDYADAFIGRDGRRRDGPTAAAALAIIAKYTGQPPALLSKGLGYVDPDERLDVKDVLHQIAWYKSQRLLKPELDGAAIIDRRYVVDLPAP